MQTVTVWYLEGIKEGRAWLGKYGMEDAQANLDSIKRTIKNFDASSPVGQMLRGERDFWKNQLRIPK